MIILLSPAKRQVGVRDSSLLSACPQESVPRFQAEAEALREHLSTLSKDELCALFTLSERKAEELYRIYQGEAGETRALDLFRGPAFSSLLQEGLSEKGCRIAGLSLRILSGLYGYLRPFDRVASYRLDLVHPLPGIGIPNLHDYWEEKVSSSLLKEEELLRDPVVLDLASKEYSSLISTDKLHSSGIRRITPDFFTLRGERERRLSVHTKQGRGGLARQVLEARAAASDWDAASLEEAVRNARWEGFRYDPRRSKPDRPVFLKED